MPLIRKAGVESIDVIQQLTSEIWPHAYQNILGQAQLEYMLKLLYSKETLTRLIDKDHQQFIIAYENEAPIGFASYSPKQNANQDIYRLHKLYLLPGRQGKGNGEAILTYIMNEMKIVNATVLELNVNRQNTAINFYTKMGFRISHEEDIDIGNGYFMNDYVMRKEL